MNVVHEGDALDLPVGSVVTVGTFDGVHVGHQAVLNEVCQRAAELGVPSIVAVFDRHPATVVRPETAPRLLTDLTDRVKLLSHSGVEFCYVLRFDEDRSLQPPEEFVAEVIEGRMRARAMVVGEDFHFGHRRRGDTAVLANMESAHGFKIIGMRLVSLPDDDGPISSTAIREALGRGDIASASQMLGRDHQVRGVVEHGDHRGRTIGFPTANVAVPGDIMLPSDGVYSGWYRRATGEIHPAAINLGRRPTFYDESGLRLLEAHLLDFDDDLYGEHATVSFTAWLRGEVKFPSVDDLVQQLRQDVGAVRHALI